jgi:hypothetical protein
MYLLVLPNKCIPFPFILQRGSLGIFYYYGDSIYKLDKGKDSHQREGKKEAEERRYRAEDHAASRGMQMFLGCGKRRKDGYTMPGTIAENTSLKTLNGRYCNVLISGQTLEMVPTLNDLNKVARGARDCWRGHWIVPAKGDGGIMT